MAIAELTRTLVLTRMLLGVAIGFTIIFAVHSFLNVDIFNLIARSLVCGLLITAVTGINRALRLSHNLNKDHLS